MNDRLSPWRWIYSTGGLGFLPGAPGTYASVACVIVWYVIPAPTIKEMLLSLVLLAILGVASADRAVMETGESDPSCVVIDEWVGQGLALIAVPHTILGGFLALVFFRFFDILKPPPIRWLEKSHGGVGVMLDDVGAGVMAGVLLHVVYYLLSGLKGAGIFHKG